MSSLPGNRHAAPGLAAATGIPDRAAPVAFSLVAIFLVALLPLLMAPVLPMIDFYNHMVRYHVLASLPGDTLLAANYAPAWALLPNVGLDVIIVGLMRLAPGFGPKATVTLILAVQFFGVLAYNRALTGRWSLLVALLLVPLLYSYILNWGFANFLFALGLAFAGAAAWLQLRPRPVLRLAVALPVSLAIYICHGVAFAFYGLLIASLEAGTWWQARPRRPAALVQALALCLVQAVVPTLLFLSSRTARAAGGISTADDNVARLVRSGGLAERLRMLAGHRLETIVRVAEGPGFFADALWLAVVAALLVWLWRSGRIGFAAAARPAVLVGILLTLLCPPSLFGIAYVADRVPLFLAYVVVGSLVVAPGLSFAQPAVAGLAALVALRLGSIAALWHGQAGDVADLDRIAAAIPEGRLVAGYWPQARPHGEVPERCEMYLHVLALRHRQVVPLFADEAAQPIALTGRLAAARARAEAAVAPLRAGPQTEAVVTRRIDAVADAGFDYVLLCQPSAARPLPASHHRVAAEAGRFRLVAAEAAK